MNTRKIRDLVKKHLSDKPRNTTEINEWISKQVDINSEFDLAAILESDPSIVRIGRVRRSGVVGKISPLRASLSFVKLAFIGLRVYVLNEYHFHIINLNIRTYHY